MKPLIISIAKSEKNEIKFTKEEFEKIVEEVYLSGVCDGKQSVPQLSPKNPIQNWEPYCRQGLTTARELPLSFVTVTCMGGD